jgi:hypothetical protein
LQEVDNLERCEIFERKALEAMLFGMDCLVQEVHMCWFRNGRPTILELAFCAKRRLHCFILSLSL